MTRRFKSILVPIDFSRNTDIAISKAVEMCTGGNYILHLLHVQQISYGNVFKYLKMVIGCYSWMFLPADISKSENRLEYLKLAIESAKNCIKVYISVCYGETVENVISKKAVDLGVDLVVLGKRSSHSSFPNLNTVTPTRVALSSGVPVLMVKPGSLYNALKKVVIPVGVDFPTSKLAIIEALQNRVGLEIILVVFPYDKTSHTYSKQTLLNTFRALKSQSANQVRYEMLQGRNKARTLVNYCLRIEADMLIVHPGFETRVGCWINTHISDLLPARSRMQVLLVKGR